MISNSDGFFGSCYDVIILVSSDRRIGDRKLVKSISLLSVQEF